MRGVRFTRDLPQKLGCVLFLALSDLFGWIGGLLLALVIYRAFFTPFELTSYLRLWWFPLLGLVFSAFEGLYTRRRAFWDEVRVLWRATTLAHLAALPAFLSKLTAISYQLSAFFLVASWLVLLFLLPLIRLTVKKFLPLIGLWRKRVLILGARRAGEVALRAIEQDPILGYEVVGFLDDDPNRQEHTIQGNHSEVRVLGPLSHVQQVFERTDCRDVLIALPHLSQEELLQLIHQLQVQGQVESVRVIPNLGFLSLMGVQIDQFLPERLFMLTLADNLAKPWNLWFKRVLALVVGGILTLLALPVIGLIGLFIRWDSHGPVFYTHERLGQGGRLFRCYKFRSMYVDQDERLKEHLKENPQAQAEWKAYRKLKSDDPRVTPVGRFLRSWSLDELPQLFNVLKGEMSLIGPRPYLPEEQELAGPELGTILQTRPGITGLWQVTGKNELPFAERVQMESWYVRNWSLWLDLIILIRTVKTVLKREGAY